MTSAVLFGSISTVADTSELQRRAFNEAFAEHGLDWDWDRDTYLEMLRSNGGRDRVAAYAREQGQEVDAEAVHATKSRRFQELLASSGVAPRPGVAETVRAAKDAGLKVGLVTTTSADNIRALLDAVDPTVRRADFDVVVDATTADESKPDPASYLVALKTLGVEPGSAVAVEDNVGGVDAANAAGVTCVAFPNTNTASHDFDSAERRVDRLDPDALMRLATHA